MAVMMADRVPLVTANSVVIGAQEVRATDLLPLAPEEVVAELMIRLVETEEEIQGMDLLRTSPWHHLGKGVSRPGMTGVVILPVHRALLAEATVIRICGRT